MHHILDISRKQHYYPFTVICLNDTESVELDIGRKQHYYPSAVICFNNVESVELNGGWLHKHQLGERHPCVCSTAPRSCTKTLITFHRRFSFVVTSAAESISRLVLI